LDKEPRVPGHTLVISTIHYSDISQMNPTRCLDFFEGLIDVSRLLKKKLRLGKFGKVYVMSMCEHWNDKEIGSKFHTEHLHFHLLPRYPKMRRNDMAGELLFVRPPGAGLMKRQVDVLAYLKEMKFQIN